MAATIKAKYKSYCKDCYHTIWKGERIKYDGQVHHLDCLKAIADPTPRQMNPQMKRTIGKVKKRRVRFITGREQSY